MHFYHALSLRIGPHCIHLPIGTGSSVYMYTHIDIGLDIGVDVGVSTVGFNTVGVVQAPILIRITPCVI